MLFNFPNTEKLITLQQAREDPRLAVATGKPSFSTVWKYCTSGWRGVTLEHTLKPGGMRTSSEAIGRWQARCLAAPVRTKRGRPPIARKRTRSEKQRQRGHDRAMESLRLAGVVK